jgi:hypothetical protein
MATSVNNIIVSKYLTRPIVQQRNSVTLTQWASYTVALAIPDPASADWIRQRVVAESVPSSLQSITLQTIGYFLQDQATVANILQFISEDNDDTVEESLSTTNSEICSTFMTRFAASVISPGQVSAWCAQNNVPDPNAPPPEK